VTGETMKSIGARLGISASRVGQHFNLILRRHKYALVAARRGETEDAEKSLQWARDRMAETGLTHADLWSRYEQYLFVWMTPEERERFDAWVKG
jgi:hypothetical protein